MKVWRVANGLNPSKLSLTSFPQSIAHTSCSSSPSQHGRIVLPTNTFQSSTPIARAITTTASNQDVLAPNKPPKKTEHTPSSGETADISDLLRNIRPGGSQHLRSQPATGRQAVASEFRSLFGPKSGYSEQVMRNVRNAVYSPLDRSKSTLPKFPGLRLNPSLGRTVAVDPRKGIEVASAISLMESQCARNKIRSDEREQKFHIRKGQKRKILKSQRWRKLFKSSFQATVARCMELKRQGW
ncbi:hypothetical protein FQN57_003166 [Myotisia sp. PD_48]|nr:hypothetical protein FQN57_003166 [Myotisia sp. PD_48]